MDKETSTEIQLLETASSQLFITAQVEMQYTPRKNTGTPVNMMMSPIPQTTGSEYKLKIKRKAQNIR
ncbi:hypothetical protein lerEdw1_000898 [Lerista edwardsae]|nr:hypothetical protein lerEdw1_000898 [Lerista edwardsae]